MDFLFVRICLCKPQWFYLYRINTSADKGRGNTFSKVTTEQTDRKLFFNEIVYNSKRLGIAGNATYIFTACTQEGVTELENFMIKQKSDFEAANKMPYNEYEVKLEKTATCVRK